jgi:ribosomal protein L13
MSQSSSDDETSDEYSTKEVQNMDSLIISLSLDFDDSSRRSRLASLFAEELSKPDRIRFTGLFDQVLTIAGDRVHAEVKKKALENANTHGTKTGDEVEEQNDDLMAGKSPEEKHLWALVDMMVQSKTLVKRASGDLGSKGTFR